MEGGEEYLHYKLEGVPSVSYLFRGAGQNGRHADHGRITRVEIDVGGREEERARAFLKTFLSPLFSPDYSHFCGLLRSRMFFLSSSFHPGFQNLEINEVSYPVPRTS